jgi:uncharacterized protein (TIGR00255 family)
MSLERGTAGGENSMSLKSMTGFARSDGRHGVHSWHWEARAVNGRGLDVRLRMPTGYETLEQPVREACKKRLARGNCSLTLSVQRDSGQTAARLNEDMFRQVVQAAEQAGTLIDAAPPTLDALLSMRGVIEYTEAEEDDSDLKNRLEAVLGDFSSLLDSLIDARETEGKHLTKEISGQVDEIENLVGTIEQSPARQPDVIAKRLQEQIAQLIGDAPQLDEQRLHQEAVLLSAKADVEEELARLKAHVAAARDLLGSAEPVGRKFDFLTQEFNREANTICSKANASDITKAGLELKAVIDRIREQVQNIE